MSNKPDVRIRLSAEGVQEVVAALKQVQAQANKTANGVGAATQGAGAGFESLTAGLGKLQPLLAAVATAATALAAVNLGQHYLAEAAALQQLSVRTGTSVEDLSRLMFMGKQVGLEFEQMGDVLTDFTERVADAAAGSGDLNDAAQAMHLKLKNSKGELKSQGQLLGEIANKFAGYADGQEKTALAIKLFGDAGVQLLPILNQGAEGMRKMGLEADKLGVTVSTKTAKEAVEFKQNLALLSSELDSIARAIMGPVIEALGKLAKKFNEARNAGAGLFTSLGAVTSATLANVFGEGEANIVGYRTELNKAAEDISRIRTEISKRENGGNTFGLDVLRDKLKLAEDNYKKLRQAKLDAEKPETAKPKDKPKAPQLRAQNASAVASAIAALEAAKSAAALAQTKADIAAQNDALSRSYADKLISLTEYNDKRMALIKQENAAEIQAAKEALAAAEKLPGFAPEERLAKEAAIAKAKSDIQLKEMAGELRVAQAIHSQAEEVKALNEEWKQYATLQKERHGDKSGAALDELDDEIKKLDELLKKRGVAEAERERMKEQLRSEGTGRINFDQAQRDTTGTDVTSIDAKKAEIARQLATGKLWGYEAEAKTLELEKERVKVLEQVSARMTEAAKQSGDPELIKQAQEYAEAVRDMKAATDEYGKSIAKLREGIQQSVEGGLNTMLDSIVEGTATAGEAVRGFAYEVVNSIRKMVQEMMVQAAIKAFFGSFGGGGMGSIFGAAAGAAGYATGGYIAGPGTGTSDSIPAWLSNGEFVIKASAVRSIGVDTLNHLNTLGRLPAVRTHSSTGVAKYADGGLVGSLAESNQVSSRLEIGLDDGLVLKTLQSSAGQTAVVKALGNKKRAARQLGI